MDYPVTGIDVSKWQKQVDWEMALGQGISFAFIRASEGNKQIDACFERNMMETARLGIPRGVYHYFKPGKDWKKQVDLFSSVINSWQFELEAVVDVEVSDGLNKNDLNNLLAKFIKHCQEGTGRRLMVYTSAGFFNRMLPLTDYAWRCRLWAAHWTQAPEPLLPYEWRNYRKSWTFWQYSAKNNALGGLYGVATKSIGLNRFNGGRESFIQAYRLDGLPEPPAGDPKPPPPPPAGEPLPAPVYCVSAQALHVFSAPRLDAHIVGGLEQGDTVQLRDVCGSDEVWVQIAPGGWCLFAYNGNQLLERCG